MRAALRHARRRRFKHQSQQATGACLIPRRCQRQISRNPCSSHRLTRNCCESIFCLAGFQSPSEPPQVTSPPDCSLNWRGGAKHFLTGRRDGDRYLIFRLARNFRAAALLEQCLLEGFRHLPPTPNRTEQSDFNHVGHGRHQQAHQPSLETPNKRPIRNGIHQYHL